MDKKTKNLTIIKHSLRNFPSKRTLTNTIHHLLSTTHKTLHYLTNSTTKLRKKLHEEPLSKVISSQLH